MIKNGKQFFLQIFIALIAPVLVYFIFVIGASNGEAQFSTYSEDSGTWQCSRHGFQEKATCPPGGWTTLTTFGGGSHRNYEVNPIHFYAHRHGGSEVRAVICLFDSSGSQGPCQSFSGKGSSLGPELGGTHPKVLYKSTSMAIFGVSEPYILMAGTYVEDAESWTEWSAKGYTEQNAPPEQTEPPAPPSVGCAPTNQVVGVGQSACFSGPSGGNYSWSANDGSPDTGSGESFCTTYAIPDSGKTVRMNDNGDEYQCYVVITEEPQEGSPEQGKKPRPPPTCGDNQWWPPEQCDLGAQNGACPSACSSTCQLNTCGSCELPTSPYFSENSSDLVNYAKRLTNNTCYYDIYPVSSACWYGIPPSANVQGEFRGRGSDGGQCGNAACNDDNICSGPNNACPGAVWGTICETRDDDEALKWERRTCKRRYDCGTDTCPGLDPTCNTAPTRLDLKCDGNDNCVIPYNGSSNLTWTTTAITPNSCVASGDWSGSKADQDTVGESTGPLTLSKTYTLTCGTSLGQVTDTVAVIIDFPPVICSPGTQSAPQGQPANINVTGGTGTYSWSAPGGSPSSGTGSSFSPSYSTTGSHTVSVSSDVQTATCIVYVPPPPTVSNVTVTLPDYCQSGPGGTVNWTYNDPNTPSTPQNGYRVQILNSSTGAVVHDSCPAGVNCTGGQSTSYAIPQGVISFGTNYYARVRAWNSLGGVSGWVNSSAWSTPVSAYPLANFDWSPTLPAVNADVQFTDISLYQSTQGTAWLWTFGDGTTANVQNPVHSYGASGNYSVQLRVTDSAGQSCQSAVRTIFVQKSLPFWREVLPR